MSFHEARIQALEDAVRALNTTTLVPDASGLAEDIKTIKETFMAWADSMAEASVATQARIDKLEKHLEALTDSHARRNMEVFEAIQRTNAVVTLLTEADSFAAFKRSTS